MFTGVEELIGHFVDFFWGIGYFGWQLSALFAIYITSTFSLLYLGVFVVSFLLLGWLNGRVFKYYIHDLRPADSTPFLVSEKFQKRTNGMPSGHAQQTAFSLTFAYLTSGKYFYESWVLFLITVIQRYVYKNHTFAQLFVGGLLGWIFGLVVVNLLRMGEIITLEYISVSAKGTTRWQGPFRVRTIP